MERKTRYSAPRNTNKPPSLGKPCVAKTPVHTMVNNNEEYKRKLSKINKNRNLRELRVDNEMGHEYYQEPPPSIFRKGVHVTAYFSDHKKYLIEKIKDASEVFGCVAWLTDPDILTALEPKTVQIVIQKEDFLRPDTEQGDMGFAKALRIRYEKLSSGLDLHDISSLIKHCHEDESVDSIRCMGNVNLDKNPSHPRMHNKFLVFCKRDKPYAVWTGSFNFTKCSTMSMENAVYIEDMAIAKRYYDEWFRIFMLSEKLNWKKEWCRPEFHIGT